MMTRLQVTMDAGMRRRAKRRADELGISLAEFVRRALDDALESSTGPRPDISEIFGIANSGGSNVAEHKDEYLADAIQEHLEQRRR